MKVRCKYCGHDFANWAELARHLEEALADYLPEKELEKWESVNTVLNQSKVVICAKNVMKLNKKPHNLR